MAIPATSAAATMQTSSYRVKFKRQEFLDLVELAKPPIIYKVKRIHFFSYQGSANRFDKSGHTLKTDNY